MHDEQFMFCHFQDISYADFLVPSKSHLRRVSSERGPLNAMEAAPNHQNLTAGKKNFTHSITKKPYHFNSHKISHIPSLSHLELKAVLMFWRFLILYLCYWLFFFFLFHVPYNRLIIGFEGFQQIFINCWVMHKLFFNDG